MECIERHLRVVVVAVHLSGLRACTNFREF